MRASVIRSKSAQSHFHFGERLEYVLHCVELGFKMGTCYKYGTVNLGLDSLLLFRKLILELLKFLALARLLLFEP